MRNDKVRGSPLISMLLRGAQLLFLRLFASNNIPSIEITPNSGTKLLHLDNLKTFVLFLGRSWIFFTKSWIPQLLNKFITLQFEITGESNPYCLPRSTNILLMLSLKQSLWTLDLHFPARINFWRHKMVSRLLRVGNFNMPADAEAPIDPSLSDCWRQTSENSWWWSQPFHQTDDELRLFWFYLYPTASSSSSRHLNLNCSLHLGVTQVVIHAWRVHSVVELLLQSELQAINWHNFHRVR